MKWNGEEKYQNKYLQQNWSFVISKFGYSESHSQMKKTAFINISFKEGLKIQQFVLHFAITYHCDTVLLVIGEIGIFLISNEAIYINMLCIIFCKLLYS